MYQFILSLEKAMAPHSSTLAWKIPRTEEPDRLQSMGLLRVGHNWATSLSLFTFTHWRRKSRPTPVFLPGESQGWGNLVGCRLWGRIKSDTIEQSTHVLDLMLSCCCLKILNGFWTRVPEFSFCTRPCQWWGQPWLCILMGSRRFSKVYEGCLVFEWLSYFAYQCLLLIIQIIPNYLYWLMDEQFVHSLNCCMRAQLLL